MKSLKDIFSKPGRLLIANAPEGIDALVLATLAQARAGGDRGASGGPLLHVARDEARMARLLEQLRFFAPELSVIAFPAWDCLPYDRVSPHRDVVARRVDALTRLLDAEAGAGPPLVVTTVNALLQRVPPREALGDRVLQARAGEGLAPDLLLQFLSDNGYVRAESVVEAGEYAVRGGIVDLFPPGAEQPLRLDFFGDELESIRTFDPLSQRSSGQRDNFLLRPVSELFLDPDSIERFRSGYREAFGAVRGEDPLYDAVSEGRLHHGMEHWVPLFYARMATLLDYLPGAAVTLDTQAEEARDARLESIADFYEARKSMLGARDLGGVTYKPLASDRLYLTASEWDELLADRPVAQLWPFAAPERSGAVFDAQGRAGEGFAGAGTTSDSALFDAVVARIADEQKAGRRVAIAAVSSGSLDRLEHLLVEHGMAPGRAVSSWSDLLNLPVSAVGLAVLEVERGFATSEAVVFSEQDILGQRIGRGQPKRKRPDNFLTEVSALHEGDLVVHADNGIGRYEGLITLDVGGAPHDCLRVIYQGGDKLFVPVENIDVLSRYGSEEAGAELDRLGQGGWQARKARVKRRLKMIADALIKVASARELRQGDVMLPPEGIYDEFCARFPYPETEDQTRAITETLDDLAAGRPMDRLICGDVGFGKTEIALRAALVAVMTGRQVAVIVPTTLLCRQHAQTFAERFAGLPVKIGHLSRMVSAKAAAEVKAGLKDGTVDIVIGTHALLAKTIEFRDIGLLVIDEEQHFGVKQKERLKQIREEVHVLTLTATPIPRTLQLALSGVREMSMIATPPVDRLAVRTFVLPYDPVIVREAILREYFRGGQSFYVCPRIEDLAGLQERLTKLIPEVKVAVAHGRLGAAALEAVMAGFIDRQYDVLLSTNIIESGLDIPSANTLIMHRADMFGLAQLYQIRGRIGRSKLRGYAYLTLPPGRLLSASAEKRLQVMQTLDTLGAGFSLASHDMDIRGAGNLLGEEQTGHIREIGVELYQQLLEEAVAAARRGGVPIAAEAETWTPQINIGTPVLIPERYVPDLNIRLGLYRRMVSLVDRAEIDAFAAELIDRFGSLPDEVENLLQIVAIKRLCRNAGVEKIDAGPKGAVVSFHKNRFAKPEGLVAFIQRQAGTVNLRPDHKLVYRRQWDDPGERIGGVRRLLDDLAKVAA